MPDLRAIAEALRSDEPALVSSLDFGPFVTQGCGSGPAILIGDASEISLFNATSGGGLEYRMSLLAHAGDIVLVRQRDRDFEEYLAAHLGMARVTFLEIGRSRETSIAHLARRTPWVIDRLVRLAIKHSGLTLKAYITTGHIWRLAQLIGEVAQTTIHVCGPSPRLARRANDKLWFSDLVHRVVGPTATPPTFSSYGPAATAALVAKISKTAQRVVVKVPDSAGSAGNIGLRRADVQGRPLANVRSFLLDSLHTCGWRDTYPVLVGVWDDDVVCSPSAQLWIPEISEGLPVCEGVFEQSVAGVEGRFVGAARSTLPTATQADLADQAVRLASVLQEIGYFGRCSLDAVIQRHGMGPYAIHWIECNGRWGGVSIPLTALRSRWDIVSDAMVITQAAVQGLFLTTAEVLGRIDDLLATPGNHGLILTAPTRASSGTLFSACAVAGSDDEAEALIAEAMTRLRRPHAV